MSIITIREGVTFRDDAARSFRRLEAEVGPIPCNSTFRDPELQRRMHEASLAYENGTGPYPGHSYAAAPEDSEHCKGLAFDANRAYSIRPAAWRHGWRWVTRANEEHHLEYKPNLDQYYNDPDPEEEMNADQERKLNQLGQAVDDLSENVELIRAALLNGTPADLSKPAFTQVVEGVGEIRTRVRGGKEAVDMPQDILGQIEGARADLADATTELKAVLAQLTPRA